jgi:hypothetical protein
VELPDFSRMPENPMSDERLPLAELWAKAGAGDFLRSAAVAVAQLLMKADVQGLIGAGRLADLRPNHPRSPPSPDERECGFTSYVGTGLRRGRAQHSSPGYPGLSCERTWRVSSGPFRNSRATRAQEARKLSSV